MARKLEELTGVKAALQIKTAVADLADSNTLIGIELEVENAEELARHVQSLSNWNQVVEGSLRDNGIEIVTPPIQGQAIGDALGELQHVLSLLTSKVRITERTGLHVHLDFRSETVQTLFRFLVLYLIFEKTLLQQCGEGREDNAYCVPLCENELLLELLPEVMSRSDAKALRALRHFPKYSALNLKPLTSLGTVEFRSHEGTSDPARILAWVNVLLSLKKYAKENETAPQAIIDSVCAAPQTLYTNVFGKWAVVPYSSDVSNGMLEGARAAQYMYRAKEVERVSGDDSLLASLYEEVSSAASEEVGDAYSRAITDMQTMDAGEVRVARRPRPSRWTGGR